jgi:hypothetical protein
MKKNNFQWLKNITTWPVTSGWSLWEISIRVDIFFKSHEVIFSLYLCSSLLCISCYYMTVHFFNSPTASQNGVCKTHQMCHVMVFFTTTLWKMQKYWLYKGKAPKHLSELIDWRYSQSRWYYRTSFVTVNCYPSNLLSGKTLPPPPLPYVNKNTVLYTLQCVRRGGGGGRIGFCASDR